MNKKDWVIKTKIDVTNIKNRIDSLIKNENPVDTENLSTFGESSLQFSITDFDKIKDITDNIKNLITILCRPNFNLMNLELKVAWTIYGQKYGFHEFHNHIGWAKTDISAVLFLKTPQKNENLTGELHFVMREENKNNDLSLKRYAPEEGDLIFFPSHVLHGTTPQSEGLRHTLNMDFKIV